MFDKKLIRNFDFLILLLITLIVGFGLIGIGIATKSPIDGQDGDIVEAIGNFDLRYVRLQLIWFISGLAIMGVVISIDYKTWGELSGYFYWAVIGLLVWVLVGGYTAGGATRWIDLGFFRLQPSEFAKVAIILSLARTLSKNEEGVKTIRDMIPAVLQIALPLVLIMRQPDLGTSLVFIFIIAGMLFVSGLSYKLIALMIGAGVVAVPIMWFFVLDDYQKTRIEVFLNPDLDPLGSAYHVIQSMTAIGSGQLYGKIYEQGLLWSNTLSQLNFLPEKNTDFIFSVTAEALGFVGGVIIIALYLALILRTVYIATKAKDSFGSLLAIGVASMTFFHVFENIGMTIGLMPVTGLPLPFMSYGGSSMWTNMIAFALVINVGMRRQKIKF